MLSEFVACLVVAICIYIYICGLEIITKIVIYYRCINLCRSRVIMSFPELFATDTLLAQPETTGTSDRTINQPAIPFSACLDI